MDNLRVFSINNDEQYEDNQTWIIIAENREEAACLFAKDQDIKFPISVGEYVDRFSRRVCINFSTDYNTYHYIIEDLGPVQKGVYQ